MFYFVFFANLITLFPCNFVRKFGGNCQTTFNTHWCCSSVNPKHATLSDIVVLVDPLILSESIVSNNLLVFLNLFSSFLNFLKTSRTFLKHDCCSVSKKLKFLTSFNFSAPIFSHFWKSVLILG